MHLNQAQLQQATSVTLKHLKNRLGVVLTELGEDEQQRFFRRLEKQLPDILEALLTLYGDQFDFFYHLEQVLLTAATAYAQRSDDLRQHDIKREPNPDWFKSEQVVGMVCYVGLFASDLAGVRERISYFQELGVNYLHLMPLFRSPVENSDGGYAVSSYRDVNPDLGTIEDLTQLASALREHDISLVVDFVYNHTSDEHIWAQKALAGDEHYQNYYYMFPNRTQPDLYEQNLREIFPEQASGNFTWRAEIERWVWTTFNTFQWDLNYRNPDVFREMLGEMLFLANSGIEVVRLDAVAFTWKEMGTPCENLPQAHTIIQAYNALLKVVAPSVLLKSEAIVHPDEVARYFGQDDKAGKECQLSYHPLLMVLLWESLATRKVSLMQHAMQKRFRTPENTAWVNYVRVHDDIGWGFADEDAAELGINGFDHRHFLNQFYTGQFEGSFAMGLPFNYNPRTQDMRISGTTASLAGLEQALNGNNAEEIEASIRRILLIHAIILSIGGIPLLYHNDEIGRINDYTYEADNSKAADNRWVHRPQTDWQLMENRHDPHTIEGRIFQALQRLITLRKSSPVLASNTTRFIHTDNPHVFAYLRGGSKEDRMLVVANFDDYSQQISGQILAEHAIHLNAYDLITEQPLHKKLATLELEPHQFMWIVKQT